MNHRSTVEKEIRNLQNDNEIREAVTQAVRVLAAIKGERALATSNGDPQIGIDLIQNLDKLGILIQVGDAPNPKNFLNLAGDYFCQTEHYDI